MRRRRVARWTGASWSGLAGGPDSDVLALASFDDGRGTGPALVAGGRFSNVGATAAAHLARWSAGTWSELSGGVEAPTGPVEVAALHVAHGASGRSLYAGGRFQSAGPQGAGNLARYDACDETGRTYCYGDGSETACPCGNASAVGERAGCLHSLGTGGTLRARGEPSLASDTLSIDGASIPNSSALYFQGLSMTAGGSGVTFGDGIKCTNGPCVRLLTKVNASCASTLPEAGDPSASVKGLITGPGTRHYQVRYRNAAVFCSSETFNSTNAVEVVWRL